ncbi:MAG: carbamoyltransferase N-terminal domain-containing protein, partial [Gemmatimonadales bacterium]
MKIVGISGFEGAMAFQRSRWPHLDEREYRISQGHDAAAALVVDGTIVAAVAEERIDRHKHSANFPKGAIKYCLSEAGLRLDQIDALVHSFDYAPYRSLLSLDATSRERYRTVYSREALGALIRRDLPGFPPARVDFVAHHVAHAASAYYTSGWSECLIVVLDGLGEVHSGTIFRGRGGRLEPIAQIGAQDSIGILYSLVTLHLGFDFNSDEYKIMGLAPYGTAERFRSIFEEAVRMLPDGGIRIDPLRLNGVPSGQERHLRARAWLTQALGPPRAPHDAITDRHRDIAAALQECLDRTLLALYRH